MSRSVTVRTWEGISQCPEGHLFTATFTMYPGGGVTQTACTVCAAVDRGKLYSWTERWECPYGHEGAVVRYDVFDTGPVLHELLCRTCDSKAFQLKEWAKALGVGLGVAVAFLLTLIVLTAGWGG